MCASVKHLIAWQHVRSLAATVPEEGRRAVYDLLPVIAASQIAAQCLISRFQATRLRCDLCYQKWLVSANLPVLVLPVSDAAALRVYIVYSDTHIHADREVQAQGCRHSLRYTQKLVWRTLAAYLKSINSGVYLLGGLATWNS